MTNILQIYILRDDALFIDIYFYAYKISDMLKQKNKIIIIIISRVDYTL